jgi:hypothetical protein
MLAKMDHRCTSPGDQYFDNSDTLSHLAARNDTNYMKNTFALTNTRYRVAAGGGILMTMAASDMPQRYSAWSTSCRPSRSTCCRPRASVAVSLPHDVSEDVLCTNLGTTLGPF